jgi:LPS-assembly protein
VAGIYYQPSPYLSFIAQTRMDEETLDLRRTDLGSSATWGPLSGTIAYANVDAAPGLDIDEPREEVLGAVSALITKNWSVFGSLRYDIVAAETRKDTIGVRYADDCFALAVSYQESFIEDGDITPDKAIMFSFQLKTLGTFDVSADPTMIAESGSQ